MIVKIKKSSLEKGIFSFISIALILSIIIGVSISSNYVAAALNITNVSVLAILNITNTEPNITAVTLNDDDTLTSEIDLTANAERVVTCNATVFDHNGWQDIDPGSVNATVFIQSVGMDAADDNNDHFTNRSCGRCVQITSTTAGCDCRVAMPYYANNSNTWICNISITDRGGTGHPDVELNFSDTEVSPLTTVTKLLALDTPSDFIDYGNLSVTQTSIAIRRNVTNVGNINMNLTLRGFGGENGSVTNDSYAMICDFGNITFDNHRYVVGSNTSFDNMKNLSNSSQDSGFTFLQRIDDSNFGQDRNNTFWRLSIPLSVGGLCNGTIIFGAIETNE
jgi:hypothetical protein